MRCRIALVVLLLSAAACAQTEVAKKTVPLSVSGRLAAAKTVFLKNTGGSQIPFNVIVDGIDGWGRLTRVNDAAAADLVIEISSPSDGSSVTVSSSTKHSERNGRQEESVTTSRDLSNAPIKLVIFDGRSRAALWSASEQPKSALRQKNRQDNVVEAAQKLLSKLRERVEPTAAEPGQ